MNIKGEYIWAIIVGLVGIIGVLVSILHKDLKSEISKLSTLLVPLFRLVDKLEIMVIGHAKMHQETKEEIEELKKNIQLQNIDITKIKDKINIS